MLDSVSINGKILPVPIIQGGMGVGVSLGGLAGAVMKRGGMGVISAAHPGYFRDDFYTDNYNANIRGLKDEIAKARQIAGENGLLGVNIMVAGQEYEAMVKAAVEGGADAIISGAGLPLELPKYTADSQVLIAPIVSSARRLKLIARRWDTSYGTAPDFVVIEGSLAGGHLGFKKEDLIGGNIQPLEEILPQVLRELKPYEEKYARKIPVFVAGGIFDGADIAKFIKLGASGVQMATRFIATYECDAHPAFKQAVIDCRKEDIGLVKSPAGLPGRAVRNSFIQKTENAGNIKVTNCLHCMKPCNPDDTCYCITRALINAVKGNVDNGLVFVGANAWRVDRLEHVDRLMKQLVSECEKALEEN